MSSEITLEQIADEIERAIRARRKQEELNQLHRLTRIYQKLNIEKGAMFTNVFATYPKAISLCLTNPHTIIEEYIDHNRPTMTYEIGELRKTNIGHLVVVM